MIYLTLKLGLIVNSNIATQLKEYEKVFKNEIIKIATIFKNKKNVFPYRYANISNEISWNSKCIVLSQAKKMYQYNSCGKYFSMSYSSIWTRQSYKIDINKETVTLFLGKPQFCKELILPIYWSPYVRKRLCIGRCGELRLYNVGKKWFVYLDIAYKSTYNSLKKEMGVDIGVKVPAVTITSDNKVRFFGNGREIRYIQRRFKRMYQELQARKQHTKMRKLNHKLRKILIFYDHVISKNIIKFAVSESIGVIKLEDLTGIRSTFNIKYFSNIYLWSYRRLQECIEYKAKLEGIKVLYVNPYRTSKKCPKCNKVNFPRDRLYKCKCGFIGHRDIVGAFNILHAL